MVSVYTVYSCVVVAATIVFIVIVYSTRVTSGIVSPNAASGYTPWKTGSVNEPGISDSGRAVYNHSDMDLIRTEWVFIRAN
jgi:hypothetical protein